MSRTLLLITLLLLFKIQAYAQVSFDETAYDFGSIYDENGFVSYTFKFVNNGVENLQIGTVEVSCDCIAPKWSEKEIAPKEEGFVLLGFSPLNRAGDFSKYAEVQFVGVTEATLLSIKGQVVSAERERNLPMQYHVNYLSFNTKVISLGTIKRKETVTKLIRLYNHDSLMISDDMWSYSHQSQINIRADSVIQGLSLGNLTLSFDATEETPLGYQVFSVSLLLDSVVVPMEVSATVIEESIGYDEGTVPKLVFDKTIHDFQTTTAGNTLVTSFELRNVGEGPLLIKDIQTNCGCTVARLEKTEIMPGQSASMDVSFDTKSRNGRQYKMVTVFSNDPLAPAQTVILKAILNE